MSRDGITELLKKCYWTQRRARTALNFERESQKIKGAGHPMQAIEAFKNEDAIGQEILNVAKAGFEFAIYLRKIASCRIRANCLDACFVEEAADILIQSWFIQSPPVTFVWRLLLDVDQVLIIAEIEDGDITFFDSNFRRV